MKVYYTIYLFLRALDRYRFMDLLPLSDRFRSAEVVDKATSTPVIPAINRVNSFTRDAAPLFSFAIHIPLVVAWP